VEGLHAVIQADQQSQLEDLARKYEEDGKADIAAILRQRATRLTSADLASEATEVIERLTNDSPKLATPSRANPTGTSRALPDFSTAPLATNKKRRKAIDESSLPPEMGGDL
jgi:hypothetical protein